MPSNLAFGEKYNSAFETKVDSHKVWLGVGILVAVLFAVFEPMIVSKEGAAPKVAGKSIL
ncbi:MAG: hypothetical protein AABY26_06775 [Nanoarchaeota archaeon]